MDAAITLAYSGGLLVLIVLIVLSRRARTHGGALRAGVVGAMYELQNQEKQRAVDVIVEGKAAATDPEFADGDLPQLERPRQRGPLTSSGYEIRPATTADAGGIAAAHVDSIRSIGSQFYPPDTVNAWGSGLTSELYVRAMVSGELFWIAVVAFAGGHEVLGFSSHRVDDHQHGVSVYVRGDCARRGIGSALLQAAEARARQAGATRIGIDSSLAAVEFYERHGFEEIGRGEHQLPSGQPMGCVFMQKVLVRRADEADGRDSLA